MSDIVDVEDAVKQCYSTWGETYHDEYYGEQAPYPPVHVDLQRRELKAAGARTVLDAGCGPASFLRHLAGDGFELYGFDLTPEMVAEGKRQFELLGLDPDRIWQGSVADDKSFAPDGVGVPDGFDAVVCGGVLPHIPEAIEGSVFGNILEALRPGGIALIEARNQFFSLFTANRYTYEFIVDALIRKDELVEAAGSSATSVGQALEDFSQQFRMDLPPVRKGKAGEPGYDEILSRTHNPLVLKAHLEDAGFRDVELLFYHYHCLPPMLSQAAPEFFLKQSVAMEDARDWRGYFMASAVIARGVKQ